MTRAGVLRPLALNVGVRRRTQCAALGVAIVAILGGGAAAAVSRTGSSAPKPVAASPAPSTVVRTVVTVPPTPSAVLAAPIAVVKPLSTLISPDLLLTGTTTITAAQLHAIAGIVGVTSVVPLDDGTVTVGSGRLLTLGGDPSVVRTVTPAPTASSDALWQSVARGEVSATFAAETADHLTLGATAAFSRHPLRIGSFADLRMPTVGAVVDTAVSRELSLVPDGAVVVTAPSRDVVGLQRDVLAVLGSDHETTSVLRLDLPTPGHATMSKALYVAAAQTCPGLSWSILAAIGGIESDHGADTAVSSAGAEGPMQFLPATFAEYAVDGDGDGRALIDDPADAVYTAARLLCSDGAGRSAAQLNAAIFAYNHAGWYVAAVESLAARYAAAGS